MCISINKQGALAIQQSNFHIKWATFLIRFAMVISLIAQFSVLEFPFNIHNYT